MTKVAGNPLSHCKSARDGLPGSGAVPGLHLQGLSLLSALLPMVSITFEARVFLWLHGAPISDRNLFLPHVKLVVLG